MEAQNYTIIWGQVLGEFCEIIPGPCCLPYVLLLDTKYATEVTGDQTRRGRLGLEWPDGVFWKY